MDGIEQLLLDEINLEASMGILEYFSKLTRESGSEDERKAADYLSGLLKEWGISHTLHRPNLYLSVPKKARLKLTSHQNREIRAKTPAFSIITGDEWRGGELVYIPTGFKRKWDNQQDQNLRDKSASLQGKVVMTEGFPRPARLKELNDLGIAGAVFIHPGKNIHESICTPIWGAPDLDNYQNEPKVPVIMINFYDGQELISLCQNGTVEVEFQTHLDKGWKECPLIDIFIEGTEEPDKYVLLHGHLDSWHQGIGDNATGNASMIEMARVFHKNKDKLKRSLRIAIWPGHSTGRYAGSTWFADQFALDLDENCIAQVNCDSPGCRDATSYQYMSWMSEVEDFCKDTIQTTIGQDSSGSRPPRAGDYSFHNIGLTGFYMLSSSIPEEVLEQKGYYPVGGCGANIEWHTEEDLMHVADYEILLKDLKVYTASVYRTINAVVYPFNFVKTIDEFKLTIESYQEAAGRHFNFTPSLHELEALKEELIAFNRDIQSVKNGSIVDPQVREWNEKILRLGRTLIPINFTRAGKFRHDPAVDVPPLPDIAQAKAIPQLEVGTHRYNVTLNHLTRGQNRLIAAIKKARRLVKE